MANTGRIEYEEEDRNQGSSTFGQKRWVDGGVSTDACPVPLTYYSALLSESVTRNDCPAGQYGTAVTYTLPQGAYTSTASQLDADTQAIAAFNAAKQAYANQYGACSNNPPGGTVWLPQYQNGGCFACTMVNQSDPSDVRASTNEENAQYFRSTDNAGQFCVEC